MEQVPREGQMPSSVGSRTLETATLFGIAVETAREIKAAARAGAQRPALISVVFSVIALESFMNEMTDYAQDMTDYQPFVEGPEAVLFAQVMGDAEESHARLESKFTLAKWILSGRNVDRGGQTYQDFALLTRLRNDLVHTKPNKPFIHGVTTNEEAHGALLKRFKDKHILANDNVTGSWTYLVQTKAVAEWSCRTAAHVVNDLCSAVPQNNFKTVLDFVNASFQSHVATL
jgi:hypothetical protein